MNALTPFEPLAILSRVEALLALAGQIEARFLKGQSQAAKLTPSLLAQAFRGQPVPQDPADEPAERLWGPQTMIPQHDMGPVSRFSIGTARGIGS